MTKHIPSKTIISDLRYLRLLSQGFPTLSATATEIINLEAIMHLPKPTEHFLADIHGEYEAFQHVLRTASGNIKRKVEEALGDQLTPEELHDLCTMIYYPRERLALARQRLNLSQGAPDTATAEYYATLLRRLVPVCRAVLRKYTRSKVRKSLPPQFAYIIEELLHEREDAHSKQAYVEAIIRSIIDTRRAEPFIIALCNLIQRLSVDRLHILGDIFDRGPAAERILDLLADYHDWDIQWGNHDVLWMGAAAGNTCAQACVVRLSLRYANTATLEEGYGINMLPLARLAMEAYADDPCTQFLPIESAGAQPLDEKTRRLAAQMHKAIAIIQFKLEGALYQAHPEWQMSDRNLLSCIDYQAGTITLADGHTYSLVESHFPTIDPAAPLRLTPEEEEVVARLNASFTASPRLRKHVGTLLTHGSMYLITNGCLCFHASVPLKADGTLRPVLWRGESYSGPRLMQRVEESIRTAFDAEAPADDRRAEQDQFWYLWCGPHSPLFDKAKMATFERYFIADAATHVEPKGHYYLLRNDPNVCDRLMDAFGVKAEGLGLKAEEPFGEKNTGTSSLSLQPSALSLNKSRHIINGHVPVRAGRGESPVRADGRLMVIDGGFSRAYHATTGIAGYTLVYHSRGFQLVQHEPFTSTAQAIEQGTDIRSTTQIVEMRGQRMLVADTDKGLQLQAQIESLSRLLVAYRRGLIQEKG